MISDHYIQLPGPDRWDWVKDEDGLRGRIQEGRVVTAVEVVVATSAAQAASLKGRFRYLDWREAPRIWRCSRSGEEIPRGPCLCKMMKSQARHARSFLGHRARSQKPGARSQEPVPEPSQFRSQFPSLGLGGPVLGLGLFARRQLSRALNPFLPPF